MGHHHGVNKLSKLMFEIQCFTNIKGMVQNITSANLVIDREAEERVKQAWEFFLALNGMQTKKSILFTTEEATHVQPGATAILSMQTFNRLDELLMEGRRESVNDDSSGASQCLPCRPLAIASCSYLFVLDLVNAH
jgi:hypothetical protein